MADRRKRRTKAKQFPTKGQPTFYLGDRYCTNMTREKPYMHRHKMVVGPWKDRRSLIECLFGYHNFAGYSSINQDIVFQAKAVSRAFRAYIKGYYWKDFVEAGGDVSKCTPLADDTNLGVNQWIVVSSHILPPWAPRYLPSKRYAFIKDKVPEKTGGSSGREGGVDARETSQEGVDFPRNRWEHEYWPKGMPHKVKWQRKHYSNFTQEDEALCKKFWSSLPEAKLQPGQPFTREFRSLFKRDKQREEKVVPTGIPKTMMATIMENQLRVDEEMATREAYERACRPPRTRYPRKIRVDMELHGYSEATIEALEEADGEAIRKAREESKRREEEAKQEELDTFESLFEVDSSSQRSKNSPKRDFISVVSVPETEAKVKAKVKEKPKAKDQSKERSKTKRRIQEPRLVESPPSIPLKNQESKPKKRKRPSLPQEKPKDQILRRSSRLRKKSHK